MAEDTQSGGHGFNSVNQNVFGLTALIVALVALATTTLQVLQQYYSSAEGYRRCAKSVMGLWAEGTKRKLRFYEFRIEVVFETPVIFVAKPSNKNGPIKGKPIHYIKGTGESYGDTRVQIPEVQTKALSATTRFAESQSRKWDKKMNVDKPPRGPTIPAPMYQLEVGLQSKTRSWDFIPAAISKPYANTTICHLVEIISMLGLYWKVFDESVWNLRAEGNGLILTSTMVQGLGIMVVFAKTGKSVFEERRIIPCSAMKKLTFGIVPNMYSIKTTPPSTHLELDLVFGKKEKVLETLESIGCSPETINRYEKDHKHMFSIAFEIIGMLGQVCRTRGSNFRFLPNPTSDSWFKKTNTKAAWNIVNLMTLFQTHLEAHIKTEAYGDDHPIQQIATAWDAIIKLGCEKEEDLCIETREAIHDAVDTQTAYILSRSQQDVLSVLVAHITKVLEILADPDDPLNNNTALANRQSTLIEQYFNLVRVSVIGDRDLVTEEMRERNLIWISLIFRMLCWLLLHDFDKADLKIVPSDLFGSRMPVYIG